MPKSFLNFFLTFCNSEISISTHFYHICSTPYYAFDWVYFSTAAGRKFLHYCDVVHKFSDDVIMQRRKELQQV